MTSSRMHSEASSANDNTIVLSLTPQKLRFDSRDVLCACFVLPAYASFRSRLALFAEKCFDTVASAEARKLPRRRVAIQREADNISCRIAANSVLNLSDKINNRWTVARRKNDVATSEEESETMLFHLVSFRSGRGQACSLLLDVQQLSTTLKKVSGMSSQSSDNTSSK